MYHRYLLRQPYHIHATDLSEHMEKLTSSSSILFATTKLDGEVESDEFYVKAGLKGRSYHGEIVKTAKRKPRKRGLKPWRGR